MSACRHLSAHCWPLSAPVGRLYATYSQDNRLSDGGRRLEHVRLSVGCQACWYPSVLLGCRYVGGCRCCRHPSHPSHPSAIPAISSHPGSPQPSRPIPSRPKIGQNHANIRPKTGHKKARNRQKQARNWPEIGQKQARNRPETGQKTGQKQAYQPPQRAPRGPEGSLGVSGSWGSIEGPE